MAGRPSIDLSPFAEEITDLIEQHGRTYNQVLTWLGEQGVSCKLTTLKKFLRGSNIVTAQTAKKSLYHDPVFLAHVKRAYQETSLNDEEVASMLRRAGFSVTTARHIRSVREKHSWNKRDMIAEHQEARLERTKELILTAIKSGVGRAWGRTHFSAWLQLHHPEVNARDAHVQRALHDINLEFGRDRRPEYKTKRRHQAIFDGPDHVWSVDGHEKFANFGIEIYAGIDAHSRRILWAYVGVASRKQVSVAKQYLETVRRYNVCPQRIRSDRGSETPFMADIHFQFYLQHLIDQGIVQGEVTDEQNLKEIFRDCYVYGTSIRNIRIESFWSRLLKHQLMPWLVRHLPRTTASLLVILHKREVFA